MNFWQFLSSTWECTLLLILLFGGSLLTWIGKQLAAHRQHRERMLRLQLEIARAHEQNKLAEQGEQATQPMPKDDTHSEPLYLQGYVGVQPPMEMEMEMHYREE